MHHILRSLIAAKGEVETERRAGKDLRPARVERWLREEVMR